MASPIFASRADLGAWAADLIEQEAKDARILAARGYPLAAHDCLLTVCNQIREALIANPRHPTTPREAGK